MYKNKKRTMTPYGECTRNNIAGVNVKIFRLQKKWSQKDVADQLQLLGHDVGKNAVQKMESGERFINDIELKVLSKVFGVKVEDLLYEGSAEVLIKPETKSATEKAIAENIPSYGEDI